VAAERTVAESAPGARAPSFPGPGHDCPLCPRLVAFREEWRAKQPDWFNGPVPTFGAADARLLIVGLAPGLRGANRTGRPFTGDYAGDLLYRTLKDFGLATGTYEARPDDGLRLVDTAIANGVRCVPPQNKPLPAEIGNCRPFLSETIVAMPRLVAIVALGRVAHETTVKALGLKLSALPFKHGAIHQARAPQQNGEGLTLHDSYHCSRYNTNTGVLTEAMFADVFEGVRSRLDG
jgi:uracil-DNA glycosylase family 4